MAGTRGMEWISSKKHSVASLFTVLFLPSMIYENYLMEVDITSGKLKN
jgi:hypothetical protein